MAKNNDYSQSAVNLCNPTEVSQMMENRRTIVENLNRMEQEIKELELYRLIEATRESIIALDEDIKKVIEEHGSFQDVEAGVYALKQRRVSVTYMPGLARENIPEYAAAVIEEVVNKQKVGGLLKGGLITQEQADAMSEITESFAFIIK